MLKLMVVWGYGTPTKGDVGMGTHCPGAKRSRTGMEEKKVEELLAWKTVQSDFTPYYGKRILKRFASGVRKEHFQATDGFM